MTGGAGALDKTAKTAYHLAKAKIEKLKNKERLAQTMGVFYSNMSGFEGPKTKTEVQTAAKILFAFGIIFIAIALFCGWLSWTSIEARKVTEYALFALIFFFLSLLTSGAGAYNIYYTRQMRHAPIVAKALANPIYTVPLIIVFLILLTLGFTAMVLYTSNWKYDAQQAETPAKIISVNLESSDQKNGGMVKVIRYSYTVDGRDYEAVSRISTRYRHAAKFEPGATLKACYNPANPQSSNVWNTEFPCGSSPY